MSEPASGMSRFKCDDCGVECNRHRLGSNRCDECYGQCRPMEQCRVCSKWFVVDENCHVHEESGFAFCGDCGVPSPSGGFTVLD